MTRLGIRSLLGGLLWLRAALFLGRGGGRLGGRAAGRGRLLGGCRLGSLRCWPFKGRSRGGFLGGRRFLGGGLGCCLSGPRRGDVTAAGRRRPGGRWAARHLLLLLPPRSRRGGRVGRGLGAHRLQLRHHHGPACPRLGHRPLELAGRGGAGRRAEYILTGSTSLLATARRDWARGAQWKG